jgi:hypothetical protein
MRGFLGPLDVMLGIHQTQLEVKSRRKSTRELKIKISSFKRGFGMGIDMKHLFLP